MEGGYKGIYRLLDYNCGDLTETELLTEFFAKFRSDEEIIRELDVFVAANPAWVVEGCYGQTYDYPGH